MSPTLTLDTNVVINAVAGSDSAALELLERARDGDFDVAATTRLQYEVTKQPIPDWISRLLGAPLGTPARYGLSTYGGGDYWAGAEKTNIVGLDGDHIEGHVKSGRDYFVTSDKPLARRAKAQGVTVLTPAEVLARHPKQRGGADDEGSMTQPSERSGRV